MNISHEQFTLRWTEVMPAVSAFVSAMVPNFHEAQDVLQEVAKALFTKMETYDPTRSFQSWAIGMARNEVLMLRRRHARRPLINNTEIVESLAEVCEEMAPELARRMQALSHCVNKLDLDGKTKQAFYLRYQACLKPRVIAEQMGITSGNIRVMLSRIRDVLRHCIEKQLKEQGSWS